MNDLKQMLLEAEAEHAKLTGRIAALRGALGCVESPQSPENEFGQIVRRARRAANKTLQDVATALGYSVGYVSDVESGRRAPFADDKLDALAGVISVSKEDLLRAAISARHPNFRQIDEQRPWLRFAGHPWVATEADARWWMAEREQSLPLRVEESWKLRDEELERKLSKSKTTPNSSNADDAKLRAALSEARKTVADLLVVQRHGRECDAAWESRHERGGAWTCTCSHAEDIKRMQAFIADVDRVLSKVE